MKSGDTFSRRTFLERLFTATVLTTTAPAVVLGRLVPSIMTTKGGLAGRYTIDLTQYPALAEDYGAVRISVEGVSSKIIVTRFPDDTFTAVSERCTHLGCSVRLYDSASMRFTCPCHGSEFASDGSVLRGPASSPLPTYQTFYDGGNTVELEIPGISGVAERRNTTSSLKLISSGNGSATFEASTPSAGLLLLTIHTIRGEEVLRPIEAHREAGRHTISVDLRGLPSGAYLCRLHTAGETVSEKLTIRN